MNYEIRNFDISLLRFSAGEDSSLKQKCRGGWSNIIVNEFTIQGALTFF